MATRVEHVDVGTSAEHFLRITRDYNATHTWVLEGDALDRIIQLDVDAEVIRVQLELVVLEQATRAIDVHGKACDVAVYRQVPVAIVTGRGLKSQGRQSGGAHDRGPGGRAGLPVYI